MSCRLITSLLCELCFCNKLTVDMLNEKIVYDYFESVSVVVITDSLLMRNVISSASL